jgi:hypothetical protein
LITDKQGAVVPGAQIEATNLSTNVSYKTVATESGEYSIPLVPAGQYSMTVTRDGFTRVVRPSVDVRIGDRIQVDFQLVLGAVTQEVTVTSEAPLLETASASLGQVIGSQEIANLPVIGRNAFIMATYAAGVQIPTTSPLFLNVFDNRVVDAFTINGGRSFRNSFLLNGVPDTAQEDGAALQGANANVGAIPPPDAISEVKVHTSEYAAEYGHTSGGTIDINVKSGGNQLHWVLYEYWRNDALNANSFDGNAHGVKKTIFKWNQPGAQIDGPVYIPKLYDGRNRTFFMFSWEKIMNSVPVPLTNTVPTLAERTGDFSGLTANGLPVTIFNPLTNPRVPFAGNVTPASVINPIGSKIVNDYPLPTGPGDRDHNTNWVVTPYAEKQRYDVFTTQVDQVLSAKNRLSGTFVRNNRHEIRADTAYPVPQSSADYIHWRINHVGVASWTSVLNPTTVLNVRAGYTRHQFAIDEYAQGYNPAQLGFPTSLVAQLPALFFPNIVPTGFAPLGAANSTYSYSNIYSFQGSVIKEVGKHSLKMGTDMHILHDYYPFPPSMTFAFDSTFTQQNPLQPNANQGNAMAAMLLGFPTSGSQQVVAYPAYSNHYYAVFFEDDWRIGSRLTLNLGLRWDVEKPTTERHNRENAGFNATVASPLQVPGYNLQGGLLFVSSSNRYPFAVDWKDIQPRFGAAYKLNEKTVLRGGFARFYLPAVVDNGQQNGFSLTTPYVSSIDGNVTPANSLSNPFPAGILQPTGSSLGFATQLGQSFTFSDPTRVIPHVDQFTFGIQHQLPFQFRANVSYSGSRTNDLEVSRNINALSVANLALGASVLNAAVPNPFAGRLPGTPLNGPTTTKQQLLLPFPQFGAITEGNQSLGYAWYNSLQMQLEKRFSAGLFVLVSATLSKNIEAITYINPEDNKLARSLTADDSPFRMRATGGYQLPSLKTSNAWLHGVLGGWQMNAVVTAAKGTPVTAPAGALSTGVNPAVSNPQASLYFNHCYINLAGVRQNCSSSDQSAAWAQQPSFTLGSLSPRLPNIRTIQPTVVDFSMFKTFPIHERLRMQFRAEAFNMTNTASFGAPNTTITSALFGTQVLTQNNAPRMVQLALRLEF